MKAAWYEKQGAPLDVLKVGKMPDPKPGPGEVRIRLATSGVNPGDVKKRQDTFGMGMPFSRVIPHSDGAGEIDATGEGVDPARIGERVWCFGAQSYRPFGTAAEFTVVPSHHAVVLPDSAAFEQGACLGIPGITAHRTVYAGGPVKGKTVLVQGGAGAVGQCAVALAKLGGANVFATVRSEADEQIAANAGAVRILRTDLLRREGLINELGPESIDHIIEVAFHANIRSDENLLKQGGSIASYATGDASPSIPFWPLVFKNISLFFLGSDDFSKDAKIEAASALNELLESGWPGFEIELKCLLEETATAHAAIEARGIRGRVVINI